MNDPDIRKLFEYLAKHQKMDQETAMRILERILQALGPPAEDP